MFRLSMLVFIFLFFFNCFSGIGEKLEKEVLIYAPFENSTDIYLVQKNLFLNSFFKRDSIAYYSNFEK